MQPDGKMIIAGRFSSVLVCRGATSRRINADGTLDMGFDPKAGGDVYCVGVQSDGKVLLAGAFSQLQPNGAFITHGAQLHRPRQCDGTLDTASISI